MLSLLSHTALRAQSAPGFPCALSSRREQRDGMARENSCRGNAVGCLKTESATSVHLAPLLSAEALAKADAGRGRRALASLVRGLSASRRWHRLRGSTSHTNPPR